MGDVTGFGVLRVAFAWPLYGVSNNLDSSPYMRGMLIGSAVAWMSLCVSFAYSVAVVGRCDNRIFLKPIRNSPTFL